MGTHVFSCPVSPFFREEDIMNAWLYNKLMINATRVSTYHHNPIPIKKGWVYLSPVSVKKYPDDKFIKASVGNLIKRSWELIEDESKVPDDIKQLFGVEVLPKKDGICKYPPCDK